MILNKQGKEYTTPALGETKPDILIGGLDANVGQIVVPQLTQAFFCESKREQFRIQLERRDREFTTDRSIFDSGKLYLEKDGQTDIWHIEDDILRWDVEFASKPSINYIDFDLQLSKGLSFNYQGELTQDDIIAAGGNSIDRPDDVIGSYAIYCNQTNRVVSAETGDTLRNFRTGKLCHIYRPKWIDDNGDWVWGILFIDPKTNLLRTTVSWDFLNDAKYPVTAGDVDVGYTSVGGSNANWAGGDVRINVKDTGGTPYATGANADALVSAEFYGGTNGQAFGIGVYDSDGNPNNIVEQKGGTASGAGAWQQVTGFSTNVSSNTDYFPAVNFGAVGQIGFYDTTAGSTYAYKNNTGVSTLPDPFDGIDSEPNARFSLFFTYSEVSGLSIPIAMHNRQQQH